MKTKENNPQKYMNRNFGNPRRENFLEIKIHAVPIDLRPDQLPKAAPGDPSIVIATATATAIDSRTMQGRCIVFVSSAADYAGIISAVTAIEILCPPPEDISSCCPYESLILHHFIGIRQLIIRWSVNKLNWCILIDFAP